MTIEFYNFWKSMYWDKLLFGVRYHVVGYVTVSLMGFAIEIGWGDD